MTRGKHANHLFASSAIFPRGMIKIGLTVHYAYYTFFRIISFSHLLPAVHIANIGSSRVCKFQQINLDNCNEHTCTSSTIVPKTYLKKERADPYPN